VATLLAVLVAGHLAGRAIELRSDRFYARAQAATGSTFQYAYLLTKALQINPRNEDANYASARILASYGKEKEALQRLDYIQSLAPDPVRHGEALSELYAILGRPDSAAHYAAHVLARHPRHLPSLELLASALPDSGRCDAKEALRRKASSLESSYPLPSPQSYTMAALDSLFGTNQDLNFVQRWFGGNALKKKFVERQLLEYSLSSQNHTRALLLSDYRCLTPEADSLAQAEKAKARKHQRKWRMFPGIG
jgi:hypothetical protein